MDSIRILIADYSEAFRENLAELLSARFTVRTCADGRDTLGLLDNFEPDILVLDLMLPNADVFSLLSAARERSVEVYVFSTFLSTTVQDRLLTMGIYGMLRKPCDIYQAEYNIRAMVRHLPAAVRRRETDVVAQFLLRLGMKPHREGYQQLLLAIPMFSRDPTLPLNKVIYRDIAAQFGLSGDKPVERAIRAVIEGYWLQGDTALWLELFPEDSMKGRKYPSNKHFISRLCEHLQRDHINR